MPHSSAENCADIAGRVLKEWQSLCANTQPKWRGYTNEFPNPNPEGPAIAAERGMRQALVGRMNLQLQGGGH